MNSLKQIQASIEAAAKYAKEFGKPIVTATQQCSGHMTHFRKERDDWKKAYEALARANHCLITGLNKRDCIDEVEKAKSMSHYYAHREYPSYQMHPFPTSFQATDAVLMHREAGKLLLGRKKGQKQWQFLGGFVDPKDQSIEDACRRETLEEASQACVWSDPEYLGSFRVADPRYEDSVDKIMSAIFLRFYVSGEPKGCDDIVEVRWFTKDYVRRSFKTLIKPMHYPIVSLLRQKGYL
jgi:ADP-ribose pyrophosphatase YjhB (NUDIX family)